MRGARGLFLPLLLMAAACCAQDSTAYQGPFIITDVVVEGNRSTKERVILREMTIRPGDSVRTNEQLYYLLERSRQNVFNMGLFNSVHVLPTYITANEVFITITVTERWFYWPTPIFKYSDPNFNTWWLTKDFRRVYFGAFLYRYNMRGRNETLYAKVQVGYAKEFALRYRFPFIDRKQRWGLAFGGGHTQQDEITVGTTGNKRDFLRIAREPTRSEWKGDVEATLRPAFDMRHAFRAGYVNAQVLDTVPRHSPDYFLQGAAHMAYFYTGYTFIFDQRDSKVYPRSGLFHDFKVERLGLGFGGEGEPEVTTLYSSFMRLWRTSERWSVGGSIRGKASIGPQLPYYVQQGLGYDDYVRGYEYYVVDGEHYALGKINVLWALLKPREYVFKHMRNDNFKTLYLAVYLNAFTDVGRVWDSRYAERNFLANDLQYGSGLGVNVVTSYDQVMRVEYAVNAERERAFYLHFAHPF